MKAAVLREYGKIQVEEVDLPVISGNEVLIKNGYASICGSDQHIFKGEFHPRTKLPLIPGHEFSGTIVHAGKDVTRVKEGDKVAVDHIKWCVVCPACKRGHYPACTSLKLVGIDLDGGFAEYIAVNESMVYKIPPSVDLRMAALVEVLSIGFHAANRAGIQNGDVIAIFGAGKVGQCILQAARTRTDATVFMVDILQERLDRAKKGYPDIIPINASTVNPVEIIMETTSGKGVDIAFEAVGHFDETPSGLNPVRECIKSIRGGGKVCVLGLSDQLSPLLMKELIWKEGTVITSRVSHGEFSETIEQMERGNINTDILISAELPLSETQKAFKMLEDNPARHMKILLKVEA